MHHALKWFFITFHSFPIEIQTHVLKPIDKSERMFYTCNQENKRPILKRCANTIGQVFYTKRAETLTCILHNILNFFK